MKPNIERLKNIENETMYTLEEAAALCGVTSAGVRTWGRNGKLNLIKVGCRYYVQGKELNKVIQIGS